MTNMHIHDVSKVSADEAPHTLKTESGYKTWVRAISIECRDGNVFKIALFADSEDQLKIKLKEDV